MPKAGKHKPLSDVDPGEIAPLAEETGEGGNGATHEEEPEVQEPPAQMEVKMRGTASAVRSAARKMGEQPAPPRSRSEEAEEPPVDENAVLLADPKNMVAVVRQLPRVWTLQSGEQVRCARPVEKYTCPITRDDIEEDVFSRFGGRKYKASIHPNTTTGENTILGAFMIEHPNPDEPPYIDDPDANAAAMAAAAARIPGGTDPTMRETDNLADLKASLQRRLERAQTRKEIKETEKLVREAERELESDGKPAPASAPTGPDLRDVEIAKLKEQLAEKKVDDRFAAMQGSIAELTKTVQALATRPVAEPKSNEDSLVTKILSQSQTHSKEMVDLIKTMNRPTAPPAPSTEDNFDKMLDRLAKMKTAMGGDDSRVVKFQDQLLEMAMERALGGGEDGDEEDTMKFAIKQFTPVLRTYVEKQVEKEEGGKGGEKVTKERLKEIYAEAAGKAAKDLEDKWKKDGWLVRDPKLAGPGAKPGLPAPKKPGAPAPKSPPAGKVVSREKTAEGVVERIKIEPADLSKKTTSSGDAATAEAPSSNEEVEEVRYTEMPGIGRVEIPAKPGELKYDRKRSVNFVLDSILSEISEKTPQKGSENAAVDSYVPADALEYLDDEILEQVWKASSGDELKGALGAWGDKAKIDAIEEAGKDKAVDSWVRRLIRTIQDVWRDQKKG